MIRILEDLLPISHPRGVKIAKIGVYCSYLHTANQNESKDSPRNPPQNITETTTAHAIMNFIKFVAKLL